MLEARLRLYPGLAPALLLALLLPGGLIHCREKAAPPPAAKAKESGTWPAFKATLKGTYLNDYGTDSAFLDLDSDAGGIQGALRIGSQGARHFVATKSTLLDSTSAGPVFNGLYRLEYSLDICETVAPQPKGTPYRWDGCFYYEGQKKPSRLQWGEAKVNVNVAPIATSVTAIGMPDARSLSGVFRVSGVYKK